MDYRQFDPAVFGPILAAVRERIETYGLKVRIANLPESSAADFDGVEILLKPELTDEAALFYLLHVFGHTVQWCTSEEALAVARRVIVPGEPLSDEELERVRLYEREACEYCLTLLHDLGILTLDQWISDIWAWDWEYLKGVYVRNAPAHPKSSFNYSEITFGQPCLQTRPIPNFTPRRFGMASVI